MKKYIWISFLILFVFSCGSRSKQVDKTITESKETVKSTETATKQSEKQSETQLQVNNQKSEISQGKEVKNETVATATENNSQKSNAENNTKQLKKVTYYPNGQKKSETELSENFSKVSEEKEMYRSKYQQTQAQLDETVKIKNAVQRENLIMKIELAETVETNKILSSQSEKKDMQIKKLSERKEASFFSYLGYAILIFYVLVVIFRLSKTYLKNHIPVWLTRIFKNNS